MTNNTKKTKNNPYSAVLAAFEAAQDSRRTSGWYASAGGPNVDVRSAWSWLVKRHQDLVDNDGYAKKAIGVIVNNWIGDGIMSTPTNATKRYSKLWQAWCDNIMSDFYEKRNWYGNQSNAARTTAVRGAVLLRRRIYPEMLEKYGIVPLQVQLLEPDWLDFSKDNGYNIIFGQEFDSNGRLKGYWIRDKHPGESMLGTGVRIQSTFVDKKEISLHFEDLRTGQRMGIPFGTNAILTLREMGDTRIAQQMKDKIAACFFGVTTDVEAQATSNNEEIFESIEPGMNYQLPPGKSFQAFVPPGSGDFSAMLDPTREVPALIEAIQAGILSLSEVHRSYGFVPEKVIEELSKDLENARSKSLILSVDLSAQAKAKSDAIMTPAKSTKV